PAALQMYFHTTFVPLAIETLAGLYEVHIVPAPTLTRVAAWAGRPAFSTSTTAAASGTNFFHVLNMVPPPGRLVPGSTDEPATRMGRVAGGVKAREDAPVNILGINCFAHDTAAAMLQDGEPVAFVEEERFNREKHTKAFPDRAIEFCLREA